MTFKINAPEFDALVSDVESDIEPVYTKAQAVKSDVDDLEQACKQQDLRDAVALFHDGTLDKGVRALHSSSQAVVAAGRGVSQSYRDFDAEVAERASAAEWKR